MENAFTSSDSIVEDHGAKTTKFSQTNSNHIDIYLFCVVQLTNDGNKQGTEQQKQNTQN